ncbi:uncharacterized protein LOC122508394 [Leptopilina heterotoma]|uniref:uncharacterized protein LOC122508394 n=1 Tax=Leptopilina heterotoma TaxID=63436 RepID=UPI001CA80328|nr:uncharacterized protein LOC122508394 [Leptopilina heterotoma]
MSFFKSLTFIAISSLFIVWINAQLLKYKSLTNDDFAALCAKNNVNLTEFKNHTRLIDLFFAYEKADENPEKKQNCMNSTLRKELEYNMNNIVKKCIQGSIELDESDIQQLIDESERKYCGFYRLVCYDRYLGEEIGCLNYNLTDTCETEFFKRKQENINELANLGLSFTPNGFKNFVQIFECFLTDAKHNCKKEQYAKRKQIYKDYIDTLNVIH